MPFVFGLLLILPLVTLPFAFPLYPYIHCYHAIPACLPHTCSCITFGPPPHHHTTFTFTPLDWLCTFTVYFIVAFYPHIWFPLCLDGMVPLCHTHYLHSGYLVPTFTILHPLGSLPYHTFSLPFTTPPYTHTHTHAFLGLVRWLIWVLCLCSSHIFVLTLYPYLTGSFGSSPSFLFPLPVGRTCSLPTHTPPVYFPLSFLLSAPVRIALRFFSLALLVLPPYTTPYLYIHGFMPYFTFYFTQLPPSQFTFAVPCCDVFSRIPAAPAHCPSATFNATTLPHAALRCAVAAICGTPPARCHSVLCLRQLRSCTSSPATAAGAFLAFSARSSSCWDDLCPLPNCALVLPCLYFILVRTVTYYFPRTQRRCCFTLPSCPLWFDLCVMLLYGTTTFEQCCCHSLRVVRHRTDIS